LNGNDSSKGNAGDPLSVPVPDGFEDVVIGDVEPPAEAAPALTQLDCALSYAEGMGWPVFPTNKEKKPLTEHGFKDATTDRAQILVWWHLHPDAGIGIPTGKATGVFVFDNDPDKGGDASLTNLIEEHGDLPSTQHAKTPRGGDHFFFNYPSDVDVRNSESKIGKGLDIRGEGGYAIVPGADSSRRWVNALDPIDAPAWLLEAATSKKQKPVDTDRKVLHANFGGAKFYPDGERNSGLRDLACGWWLHGHVADVQELYQRLLEARSTRCAAGKDLPATDEELYDLALRTSRNYARGELKQEVTL